MYRLGDTLLVRLPRTPDTARSLLKEQRWLPRLGPLLTRAVPEVVHAGTPDASFPLAWSVHRWIDGRTPAPTTVTDWAAFGSDLAAFVRELHALDLLGAARAGDLAWYRGGSLRPCDPWVTTSLEDCCRILGDALDVAELERLWRHALALPDSPSSEVWLHGDLKPGNLLVQQGTLRAVIDFGGLSVGLPDAEHAPVWDLPVPARHAYREALGLDDATWARARGWAIAVGAAGIAYYRDTFPAFVAECRARLEAVLAGD
jgi:aminoglycoside phosphotransferase (APT) family kinase protein